ncbi:MAG TPA: hypothetical protein VG796_20895 [Verrucomicrobiales bacterium]|nr:hypothetical protein [Verrucomicrobiales bacterium]
MSLKQWADNGWLRPHVSGRQEIAGLLAIVARDLNDAAGDISADWRFGIAYNAVLKLCTVLMFSSGYRPEKNLAHYRTLAALPLILPSHGQMDTAYLDACRIKRNTVEYDVAGAATHEDAAELIAFARDLHAEVLSWLKLNHPAFLHG